MKLTKIKEMLQEVLLQFSQVTTDKGILVYGGEKKIPDVGESVTMLTEDGSEVKVEDGDYIMEDKTVITVINGVVANVTEPERLIVDEKEDVTAKTSGTVVEEETAPQEMKEEKKKACGMEEEQPMEEKPIEPTVDELKAKIAEKEAEIAEEKAEIEALKAKVAELEGDTTFSFSRRKKEESYEEKERKIKDALATYGLGDFYLCEAGDNYAVVSIWNVRLGKEEFFRYQIGYENDLVVVGARTEVVSKFVPIGETYSADEVAVLKAKIKELEEKPLAEPATETFKKETVIEKTGDKQLDNLARILNAK